jgi:hypothetical protein
MTFWRNMSPPLSGYACYLLHAGFSLGLFFDPEDRGNVFFLNVNSEWTTWHYIPENIYLQNHCCEDLKSYTLRTEVLTALPESNRPGIL